MLLPDFVPLSDASLIESTLGINHFAHAIIGRLASPILASSAGREREREGERETEGERERERERGACPFGRPRFVAVSSNSAETVTLQGLLDELHLIKRGLLSPPASPLSLSLLLADFASFPAYGRSKLANIAYATSLGTANQFLGLSDFQTLSVHPGLIFTNLTASASPLHSAFFTLARYADKFLSFSLSPSQGGATLFLGLLDPAWDTVPKGTFLRGGRKSELKRGEREVRERGGEVATLTNEILTVLLGRRGLSFE
jgi:NAD(P)-dependent dehydrogenase (short-subunit alcohol dehydrogenase family)